MSYVISDNGLVLRVNGQAITTPSTTTEWMNSLSLSISSGAINSDLVDFPLLVSLSTKSGITSADTSNIFTELGANSAKFTIQDSNGLDLPVEVESWDHVNNTASLWTSVPQVCSTVDSELTLYYDNTHADVPTIYDTASQNTSAIWPSHYKGVWHVSEDGTGIRNDSSSSNNILTPQNYSGAESISGGLVNGADALDGVDQYWTVDDDGSGEQTWLDGAANVFISFWFKPDVTITTSPTILFRWVTGSNKKNILLMLLSGEIRCFLSRDGSEQIGGVFSGTQPVGGEWNRLLFKYDGTSGVMSAFLNNDKSSSTFTLVGGGALSTGVTHTYPGDVRFIGGNQVTTPQDFFPAGDIDEVRFSDNAVSDDEIYADYHSMLDNLVTYN